jgi:hypothetical protein
MFRRRQTSDRRDKGARRRVKHNRRPPRSERRSRESGDLEVAQGQDAYPDRGARIRFGGRTYRFTVDVSMTYARLRHVLDTSVGRR